MAHKLHVNFQNQRIQWTFTNNTIAEMGLRQRLLHTRLCLGYWPVPLACPPCDLGSPIVGIRLKGVWALWAKGDATSTGQTYTCRLSAVTFCLTLLAPQFTQAPKIECVNLGIKSDTFRTPEPFILNVEIRPQKGLEC